MKAALILLCLLCMSSAGAAEIVVEAETVDVETYFIDESLTAESADYVVAITK